jgi:uncharacterized membrane protein
VVVPFDTTNYIILLNLSEIYLSILKLAFIIRYNEKLNKQLLNFINYIFIWNTNLLYYKIEKQTMATETIILVGRNSHIAWIFQKDISYRPSKYPLIYLLAIILRFLLYKNP